MNEPAPDDFVTAVWHADDDYGNGQLEIAVRHAGFAGIAKGWGNRPYIEAFAEAISAYPLKPTAAASMSLGLGVGEDYVESVGMSAEPVGTKGQIVLFVRLSSEEWRNGAPVAVNRVQIEFPTSYESVREFSHQLHLAVKGRGQQCRLGFDRLI